MIVEKVIGEQHPDLLTPLTISIGYFIINSLLVIGDISALRRAGYSSSRFAILGFLLMPVYLIVRQRVTREFQWPILVWIVCAFAALYVQDPEMLKGNVYWGVGLPTCGGFTSVQEVKSISSSTPPLRLVGATATDVQNIREVSKTEKKRSCIGAVLTSGGQEIPVDFTIEERGDKYYWQVQLRAY
jgi:hypothetical protein